MRLKDYQIVVLDNLRQYLDLLVEKQNPIKAYNAYWNNQNVLVGGINGMKPYSDVVLGVPNVCFKVPTGGGKTFLACNAIKCIFDAMPQMNAKAVVWLVPSTSILEQTLNALSNHNHEYRKQLDADFANRVEVYSKEQLLDGQNFNPTTVTEQLSIFVLTYDSFRTSSKDGRKAYRENGNLAMFSKFKQDDSVSLKDIDDSALIQVIRQLNPIMIVDESHNAGSVLSVEMMKNFNPNFILELTATPRENSNIISFVDALALKNENMVKLPVIVYNRKKTEDVLSDAISLRAKLEALAIADEKKTGRYIRPIVLFQAQPRIGEESITYEKIRNILIASGISKEEIALKVSDAPDELKNVDLLSKDCKIRYIITVNALKEGWDCPFAYVLATVANRTSQVDVEQILGRVLRLPNTKKNPSNVLNLSYVITSSNDFRTTLDKVVLALNKAGFSSRDYYAKDVIEEPIQEDTFKSGELIPIELEPVDDIDNVNVEILKQKVEEAEAINVIEESSTEIIVNDDMLATAQETAETFDRKLEESKTDDVVVPTEVKEKMAHYQMNSEFVDEILSLKLPQFVEKVGISFFNEDRYELLRPEYLSKGFTLSNKDTDIDFRNLDIEMVRVDVDAGANSTPKAWKISDNDSSVFKELISSQPAEKRLTMCKGLIVSHIRKINCISDTEIEEYVSRVIASLSQEQLADLENAPYPYAVKIKEKIEGLLAIHADKTFETWIEQEKIECLPMYSFPKTISPTDVITTLPNSLYSAEENVNDYEFKVVSMLSSMENIKWWHRNMSKKGFCINGSVNAYPDIIAETTSGKILVIETKGEHLDNDESALKAKLGKTWASLAGKNYKYFMVFEKKDTGKVGAYTFDQFVEIIKEL